MKIYKTLAILILLPWYGILSCSNVTPNPDSKLVVSTSTIITDLTQRIANEEIKIKGILKPGDDPHLYEPVPQDSKTLEQADLILYNGYNLEPALIRLAESNAPKAKKVAVGEVVTPLKLSKDGKNVPDPHIWGNVQNVILMVNKIKDELIELSPEDQAEFTKNAAQLIQELKKLDEQIKQEISQIPPDRRNLVTTHDAFQYYAKAYGLEVVGTLIGISTEEQPSAKTVKALSDAIKKLKVPTIFAETTINPKLIETVASEAKVKLSPSKLYSDSIGVAGSEADSYIKMMHTNTKTIVAGLK